MNSYGIIVTIDPGVSNGGICTFRDGKIEKTIPLAKTINRQKVFIGYDRIKEYLKYLKDLDNSILFGIEKIQMRPPRSLKEGYKAVVMQKLFKHVSMIEVTVKSLEIDFIEVPVISWISSLRLQRINENESDTDRKNRYKRRAKELYPYVNVTGWNADAILILEHLRRKLEFDPNWFMKFPIQKTKKELFK